MSSALTQDEIEQWKVFCDNLKNSMARGMFYLPTSSDNDLMKRVNEQ